jgi:hypothetical protein
VAAAGLGCGQSVDSGVGDARLVLARSSQAVGIARMTLTVAPGRVVGQTGFAPFTADLGRGDPSAVHYSGIPAGLGRLLTIDAFDAAVPPVHFSGSAIVDVPAGGTVAAAIPLQPIMPSFGAPNSAPMVDSLTIDALLVPIGATVALSAAAHDPDAGDGIVYLWTTTQSCGTFVGTGKPQTNRPTTLWVAPFAPGTCRLTLLVADGRGASVSVYVDVAVSP